MASSALTRNIVGIEAFLPQSNQKSVSMIDMGAVVHLNYLDSNFPGNRDIGSMQTLVFWFSAILVLLTAAPSSKHLGILAKFRRLVKLYNEVLDFF
jgi:hypothetical protein